MVNNRTVSKRPSFFGRGFLGVMRTVFSWKTRRMIFLSSIYGYILNVRTPDREHAEKLSKVLNVARKPEALELPIAIKSVIWRNRMPSGVEVEGRTLQISDLARNDLSDQECNTFIKLIVDSMPDWLQYAKKPQMQYDLKQLVKCLHTESLAS